MMRDLVVLMTRKGLTLSTCESFTGGMFAARLTEVSGASAMYRGSIVAYANAIKTDVVGIDPMILKKHGAISAETAIAMAQKTRILMNSDYAIAYTGNAGPSALEGKPAGLWYGAIASPQGTLEFGGLSNLSRNELRTDAVHQGMKLLLDWIRNSDLKDINR